MTPRSAAPPPRSTAIRDYCGGWCATCWRTQTATVAVRRSMSVSSRKARPALFSVSWIVGPACPKPTASGSSSPSTAGRTPMKAPIVVSDWGWRWCARSRAATAATYRAGHATAAAPASRRRCTRSSVSDGIFVETTRGVRLLASHGFHAPNRRPWRTAIGMAARDPGCVKTPTWAAIIECHSKNLSNTHRICTRSLSNTRPRESLSTVLWFAHVFTQAGPLPDLHLFPFRHFEVPILSHLIWSTFNRVAEKKVFPIPSLPDLRMDQCLLKAKPHDIFKGRDKFAERRGQFVGKASVFDRASVHNPRSERYTPCASDRTLVVECTEGPQQTLQREPLVETLILLALPPRR